MGDWPRTRRRGKAERWSGAGSSPPARGERARRVETSHKWPSDQIDSEPPLKSSTRAHDAPQTTWSVEEPHRRPRFFFRGAGADGRVDHLVKLRKRFFHPLITYKIGVDYDLRSGNFIWRSSCRDRLLGGKLTVDGSELRLVKENVIDNVRVAVAVAFDCATGNSSLQIKLRAGHTLQPHASPPGFRFALLLPHRGPKREIRGGCTQLQLKGTVQLPEVTYSTGAQCAHTEYGDVVTTLQQANLYIHLF